MIYGRKVIGTVGYMGGVAATLEEFTWAWGQLIAFNSEYLCEDGQCIHYIKAKHSFHSAARNALAHEAIGDWLLMLDTDHKFEPDICLRMLKLMGDYKLNVLSAMYYHREPPHLPIAFKLVDGNMLNIGGWPKDTKILEVDSTGGGTLLVKRDVFKRIKRELKEGPFDIIAPYGEDYSFFLRLKKLGITGWCTPLIESKHLTVSSIDSDDYDPEMLGKVTGILNTCETSGYKV
jgi:cellulose synthase/poly-beta-1,6-N-acetylglucosamine synthase-like glycosyltransferase